MHRSQLILKVIFKSLFHSLNHTTTEVFITEEGGDTTASIRTIFINTVRILRTILTTKTILIHPIFMVFHHKAFHHINTVLNTTSIAKMQLKCTHNHRSNHVKLVTADTVQSKRKKVRKIYGRKKIKDITMLNGKIKTDHVQNPHPLQMKMKTMSLTP